MSDTFDDFVSTVRAVGSAAGKVAGEAVEASRSKLQELKLQSELRETYERLGTVVYDAAKKETGNPELVEMIVGEIDGIRKKIDALHEPKAAQKAADPAQQSCPQCGHVNPADSCYCGKCGAPLTPKKEDAPAE